jgi:hypothetical protein
VSTRRIVEGNAINIGRGLNEVEYLFVEPAGGVVRSSVGREHGRDDGRIALVFELNRERRTAQFVDSHVHLRSYRVRSSLSRASSRKLQLTVYRLLLPLFAAPCQRWAKAVCGHSSFVLAPVARSLLLCLA